jgi:hypothetical protein
MIIPLSLHALRLAPCAARLSSRFQAVCLKSPVIDHGNKYFDELRTQRFLLPGIQALRPYAISDQL